MAPRGRPRQTEAQIDAEAAKIINTALAVRYRPSALLGLGFTSEAKARQFVSRWAKGQLAGRIRGACGQWVGTTIQELLYPTQNRTQAAVALVLDHGVTPYRASKAAGVDLNNLRRALPGGWDQRSVGIIRRAQGLGSVILQTCVWDVVN